MRQLISIGVGGLFCVSTALADELSALSGEALGAPTPKLEVRVSGGGLGEKMGTVPQLTIADQGIKGGHAVGNLTVVLSNKNGGAGSLTPKMTMGSGGHYAQVAVPITWPTLTLKVTVDACAPGHGTPADHDYQATYQLDLASQIAYSSSQQTLWLSVGQPNQPPETTCVAAPPPADAPSSGYCQVLTAYACIS